MVIESNVAPTLEYEQETTLLAELDKGIDDMESGRTLPHDEAKQQVTILRVLKDRQNWNRILRTETEYHFT